MTAQRIALIARGDRVAEDAAELLTNSLIMRGARRGDVEVSPLEYWGRGEWRAYGYASADARHGLYVAVTAEGVEPAELTIADVLGPLNR